MLSLHYMSNLNKCLALSKKIYNFELVYVFINYPIMSFLHEVTF